MIRKIMILTALVVLPVLAPSEAQAKHKEYCREYTKTIHIGGKIAKGYGTACQQPDGSWEIARLEGSIYARDKVRDYIYDDLNRRHKNSKIVVIDRHDNCRGRSHGYSHSAHHYKPHGYSKHSKHNYKYGDKYHGNFWKKSHHYGAPRFEFSRVVNKHYDSHHSSFAYRYR